MVGGLVLSSALNGNTFRYFSIFRNNTEGEAILRTLKRKFSVDEKESAEIACIWMNRKLDPKKRIIFYKVMLEETQKFVRSKNVKYIFGGSVDLYIQKFQEQFFSKVFYLGSVPRTDESVLSHRSGTAVMIYFSEAKSLSLQKFHLIYNLWRSIFMHKVSKLILQIKPITVKQSA